MESSVVREVEGRDVEAGIFGLLDDAADAFGDEFGRRSVREAEVEGVPLQPRRKRSGGEAAGAAMAAWRCG